MRRSTLCLTAALLASTVMSAGHVLATNADYIVAQAGANPSGNSGGYSGEAGVDAYGSRNMRTIGRTDGSGAMGVGTTPSKTSTSSGGNGTNSGTNSGPSVGTGASAN